MSLSPESTLRARPAAGGIREVFQLAYPVILTQVSTTAMNVVDSASF